MSLRNARDVPSHVRVLESGDPFQNGRLLTCVTDKRLYDTFERFR
jgi:hypothetical protein